LIGVHFASFYVTLPCILLIKIRFLMVTSLIFQVQSLVEKKAQILNFSRN